MLSITRCKQILNGKGCTYSDEEVKAVRQILYVIADLQLTNKCNEKTRNDD